MCNDSGKTKAQLLDEVHELRERLRVVEGLGGEQQQTGEDCERARLFLQSVIDGIPDALMVVNRDYTIALANQTARALADNADIVSAHRKCHELSHGNAEPCTNREHACPLELVLKDKATSSVEHIHYDPQGQEHFVEITAAPIFDKAGEVIQIIETSRDITERKRTEKRLKDSEQRNRAWIDHSPVCTKIVDLDFNLQFMSSAGVKGLNLDDITAYYGKPYPLDFYPDSFKIPMTKNLKKAKETGEIITQEAPVVDVDGNELWFHSTIVPVKGEEDRIDYLVLRRFAGKG